MSSPGSVMAIHKDDINQKISDNKERQKKKSGVPQDNYGDAYVDPVAENRHHDAGKGDKVRDMPGWYNEDVTETLENIFGKPDWKKKLDGEEEKEKKAKSE